MAAVSDSADLDCGLYEESTGYWTSNLLNLVRSGHSVNVVSTEMERNLLHAKLLAQKYWSEVELFSSYVCTWEGKLIFLHKLQITEVIKAMDDLILRYFFIPVFYFF